MFKPRKKSQKQKEFWVMADRLPKTSPSRFYELLDGTLEDMHFASEVWQIFTLLPRPMQPKVGRPALSAGDSFKDAHDWFFRRPRE